jgi:hypothetical protein
VKHWDGVGVMFVSGEKAAIGLGSDGLLVVVTCGVEDQRMLFRN